MMLDVHVWLHPSTARPAITFACHWVGCASSTYPLALSSHPRLPAHPRGGTSLDALNPTLNSIRHQCDTRPPVSIPSAPIVILAALCGACVLTLIVLAWLRLSTSPRHHHVNLSLAEHPCACRPLTRNGLLETGIRAPLYSFSPHSPLRWAVWRACCVCACVCFH